MMSVDDLASIVSKTVTLKRKGDRFVGLCPFHNEKTPSFHVWRGRRREGRFHCHGCGADGDAIDWLRKVDGKTVRVAPDPELAREREQAKQRERRMREYRDHNVDCVIPDWLLAF
jgi:DNA primase